MNKRVLKVTNFVMAFVMVVAMFAVSTDNVSAKASDYAVWSSIFNADYYYNNCADARNYAGKNVDKLWQFFVKVGIPRGDQASEEFNVFIYAKNYPELYKAYGGNMVNYYLHYAQAGKAEGRNAKTLLSQVSQNTQTNQNTVTAQTTTDSSRENAAYRDAVLELVNKERANAGLGSLTTTPELDAAAQVRANEIVNYFSHTRPDGRSCSTAAEEAGVPTYYIGENIAAGQRSPESVMNSWMNSSGHRANILRDDYNHIGIGCVYGGSYGIYWVQMFSD